MMDLNNQQTSIQQSLPQESVAGNSTKISKPALWVLSSLMGIGCVVLLSVFFLVLNSRKTRHNQMARLIQTSTPTIRKTYTNNTATSIRIVTTPPTATPSEPEMQTYVNQKYGFSFKYPSGLTLAVANDIKAQFLLNITNVNEAYALNITPGQTHNFANQTGTYTIHHITWQVIPTGRYCDAGQCEYTSANFKFFRQETCNQSNQILGLENKICGFTYEFILQKPVDNTVKAILSTFTFTNL